MKREFIEIKEGCVFYKQENENWYIPILQHPQLKEYWALHLASKGLGAVDVIHRELLNNNIFESIEKYFEEYIDVLKMYQQSFKVEVFETEIENTEAPKKTKK